MLFYVKSWGDPNISILLSNKNFDFSEGTRLTFTAIHSMKISSATVTHVQIRADPNLKHFMFD